MDLPVPVVLASSSSTRCALLQRAGMEFEVVRPEVDEEQVNQPTDSADPEPLVVRLAQMKADDVAARRPESLIIAADTVVVCDRRIIGKPVDRSDAARILTRLTRSRHAVVTGLCVLAPDGRRVTSVDTTRIRLRRMSEAEIRRYVERPGALERAGVYGLQRNDPNVERMEGSPSTVMGLPMAELREALRTLYPEHVENESA